MPKVSVIIPAYNREDFIEETVESVLNQTYKDFEIIVVDDGSTDGTKQKLKKFNSKIKLIEQKNSERAFSRNNGIKNSTGEYIALLDSDDVWIKNKLEKQTEILDKDKNIIMVYGQCLRIDENSKKIKSAIRQLKGYSGNVFENLLIRNFIASPTPLFRRDICEKITGFQTKYIPYEDWEFWLRYSLSGKFYFLNQPLAFYRIHKNQSVKNINAEKIEAVTTELLSDSFDLKSVSEEIKNKSLGMANLRFCYWYLLSNKSEIAKEKLDKARKFNPAIVSDLRWHGLNLACKYTWLKNFLKLESFH